jgi:hypothetical protein
MLADTLPRSAFPGAISREGEFGFNRIQFAPGGRSRTGFIRTHRPTDLETCGIFRVRVSAIAAGYAANGGDVTLLEEVKDGIVVQCEISVTHDALAEPTSALVTDSRASGGRPSSTRGRSFRN